MKPYPRTFKKPKFSKLVSFHVERLVKRLRCEHTHCFSFYPEKEKTYWDYRGESRGNHGNIIIKGCYSCGKMWCEDYGA